MSKDDAAESAPPFSESHGRSSTTQFRPGRSGNPAGRPIGAQGRRKVVERIAGEMHAVDYGGQTRYHSTVELLFKKIQALMLEAKSHHAFDAVHSFLKRYGPQEAAGPVGFLIVPERRAPEEFAREAAELRATHLQDSARAMAEHDARWAKLQAEERKKMASATDDV